MLYLNVSNFFVLPWHSVQDNAQLSKHKSQHFTCSGNFWIKLHWLCSPLFDIRQLKLKSIFKLKLLYFLYYRSFNSYNKYLYFYRISQVSTNWSWCEYAEFTEQAEEMLLIIMQTHLFLYVLVCDSAVGFLATLVFTFWYSTIKRKDQTSITLRFIDEKIIFQNL